MLDSTATRVLVGECKRLFGVTWPLQPNDFRAKRFLQNFEHWKGLEVNPIAINDMVVQGLLS